LEPHYNVEEGGKQCNRLPKGRLPKKPSWKKQKNHVGKGRYNKTLIMGQKQKPMIIWAEGRERPGKTCLEADKKGGSER